MKQFLCSILLGCLPLLSLAQSLMSPDGRFQMHFSLDGQGRPQYTLSLNGRPVVLQSKLGLELKREDPNVSTDFSFHEFKDASTLDKKADLMYDFQVASTETSSFDETWNPVWGEEAT